jgi:signal transduction histidine kinase
VTASEVVVMRRDVSDDPVASRRAARELAFFGREHPSLHSEVLVAGVKQAGEPEWLVARVLVPPGEREFVATLIAQTVLLYIVLVGAIALILRRITQPLAALTERLERFAETRSPDGQLDPQGPEDVRRLIVAHNAMEARISALLDEKDVMLGAIGHDLKTPLAALRVRIESVEDDAERARMAATIEDIVRSLDDILSLARVGRPSDPREQSELYALVASVVEEYEDMDAPVELGESQRIVLPLRATWLRRGMRNLIDNALRYGKRARVSMARENREAVIRIEDDGPGIAESEIERMMEPFSRGEPSRNTETGGAGLGLTLARAIAEQHGGALKLANRRGIDGKVAGLVATLRLPLT